MACKKVLRFTSTRADEQDVIINTYSVNALPTLPFVSKMFLLSFHVHIDLMRAAILTSASHFPVSGLYSVLCSG